MAITTLPYRAVCVAHRTVGPLDGRTDEIDIQIRDGANVARGGVLTYSLGRTESLVALRELFQDAVYDRLEVDAGGRGVLVDALVGRTVATSSS
jgi:hypothetical protein